MDYSGLCSRCASLLSCGGSHDVKRRILCTLLVVSLLLHTQVKSDSVKDENQQIHITHRINKDRDAELSCTVKDLGSRRVIWTKLSDPYPISVGSTRFASSKKYRVSVTGDNTFMLTVKKVTLEDAGEYQCRVSGQEYIAEIISLNIPASSDSTRLIPKDTLIVTEVGTTVVLPCHVENLGSSLVLWKNDRNDVVSLRKKIYSGDTRFKVIHGTRTEWSLQLKDVRDTDFGYYTCIINSEPMLTRTIELKNSAPVEMAPVLKRDSQFRTKVDADHGDSVTLTCNFKANPPARVFWYKRVKIDGKTESRELGQGSSLTLQSVTEAQSGRYTCVAKNGLKPQGKGKTKLTVKAPPTTVPPTTTTFVPTGPVAPRVYHHERITHQTRGRNAAIKCTAIGDPRPQIDWRRHGYKIKDSYKYSITTENSGRHTVTSTLLVKSITSRDFGKFECVTHNRLGLVDISMELQEKKP